VDAALARGSDDNLSALLVEVMALPVAAIDELHRELTQRAIPPVLAEGQLIEGYRVERIVHSGTRSHIYRVRCEADQRVLLLKAPSAALADDAAYLESFIREQWAGRRIDHSGVMKMFAPPERSAFLYHLCEYIEGQTLRQWILDHPHPPLETVRALTQEIVAALRAFQRQHMVHRDLKPENIMVTSEGRIKLIDFGTVQVGGLLDAAAGLAEEIPVGTADYSAPEYLAGEPATHRSDIFSLGAIVYEMLTGAQPYAISDRERQQPARRHWRYRSACAVRCDLPLWIDVALEKSVHPDPRQRYPALSEFMHDLSTPNRDLLGRRERRPLIERNPLRFWQALVLFLLLVETLTLMLLLPR
jgi:protein phosphatase